MPTCISLCRMHAWCLWKPEEGLDLQMAMSHHVRAGNLTCIFQQKEGPVLLTAEQPLQLPLRPTLNTCIYIHIHIHIHIHMSQRGGEGGGF